MNFIETNIKDKVISTINNAINNAKNKSIKDKSSPLSVRIRKRFSS